MWSESVDGKMTAKCKSQTSELITGWRSIGMYLLKCFLMVQYCITTGEKSPAKVPEVNKETKES